MRISDWSSDVCSSDLLPDVEREGIHTLGRHVPPLARAARAQIRRHMDGETLRRTPPTEAEQQRHHEQRAGPQTQRLHVRLQVRNLVLETAHGAPRSVLRRRSEEHTSELQSLMRISYAVFCLKKK